MPRRPPKPYAWQWRPSRKGSIQPLSIISPLTSTESPTCSMRLLPWASSHTCACAQILPLFQGLVHTPAPTICQLNGCLLLLPQRPPRPPAALCRLSPSLLRQYHILPDGTRRHWALSNQDLCGPLPSKKHLPFFTWGLAGDTFVIIDPFDPYEPWQTHSALLILSVCLGSACTLSAVSSARRSCWKSRAADGCGWQHMSLSEGQCFCIFYKL